MFDKIQNNLPDKRQFLFMTPIRAEAFEGPEGVTTRVRRLNPGEREAWAQRTHLPAKQISPDSVTFVGAKSVDFLIAREFLREILPGKIDKPSFLVDMPGTGFEPITLTVTQGEERTCRTEDWATMGTERELFATLNRLGPSKNLSVVLRSNNHPMALGHELAVLFCVSVGFFEAAATGDLIIGACPKERFENYSLFGRNMGDVGLLQVVGVENQNGQRKVTISKSNACEWPDGYPPQGTKVFIVNNKE